LAASLGLRVGDRITVYSPRTRTTITGPQPIRKNYTVGAIFSVGIIDVDLSYIYMELDQASLLFEGGDVSPDIQIRLDSPDKVDGLTRAVYDAIDEPAFLQTWRMIMLVKNKSKDIAILRTIGVTQGGILRIFLMSGAMIGILGTLAGLIFGTLFCLNIGLVQAAIEGITGQPLFPEDVYQLAGGIPVKIVWSEVFGVAFWGFLISALATLLPALSASKIDPIDALRYE